MRGWISVVVVVIACGDPSRGEIAATDDMPGSEDFPDEFFVLEGQHVEIRYRPGLTVCEGDVVTLDAHVDQVSRALGVTIPDGLIYEYVSVEEVFARCGDEFGGCAGSGIGIGSHMGNTARHELNHLIGREVQGSVAMWVEGLAVAFELRSPLSQRFHPAAMFGRPAKQLSYNDAGHFFAYAWRDLGPQTLLSVTRHSAGDAPEAALARFEAEVGESLTAYAERYLVNAPEAEHSLLPPADVPALPWQGDTWRQVLDLDCSVVHTNLSPEGALTRTVFVEVSTPGRYELATSAGFVTLEGVATDDGTAPLLDGYRRGLHSIRPVYPGVADFEAGRYRVQVETESLEPQTIALELRPKLGAEPVEPD